ncbi:glyoxylate/hydroxypyruvate reductase A-like [Stegodyphus dumicola]|uniref:glyoxylate/hydroxypyruvate reductase A-like n=1 Tax=Stegodyphus dumicola TaxID=202533 RepID=UPI0015AE01C0|nr:glyoxylate/hydroxypyruvate reductase A-like [Stegodyphus dumicola]XP_035224313.1 glyoxylate/hydroxypyruvate reductase A-like [Stegodyphus dumicola]
MTSRIKPPVYVLSEIPGLIECLKSAEMAEIRSAKTSDLHDIKNAEVAVCDGALLANAYKSMPNLKWAHCTWAGVDPVIKSIPEKPHFVLTRHGGEAFSRLIAEYVVCQILNCERNFKAYIIAQETETWLDSDVIRYYRSLDELNVGILGVGNMACGVAKFLKSRGTTVFGFARSLLPKRRNSDLFDKIYTNIDEMLPKCDYLCNTLPSTDLTSGMLNDAVLKKCVRKPVFINVGRGSIISEKELIRALRNDWISCAVLDVFEQEPLPQSSELWKMSQVIITPHVSAYSKPDHVTDFFFKNYKRYVHEEEMENVVNWSFGY